MQTDRKRKNEIKPKNGHNTDIQNPIIKKEKKIEKHPHRHKDNLSDNKCDKKNKKTRCLTRLTLTSIVHRERIKHPKWLQRANKALRHTPRHIVGNQRIYLTGTIQQTSDEKKISQCTIRFPKRTINQNNQPLPSPLTRDTQAIWLSAPILGM